MAARARPAPAALLTAALLLPCVVSAGYEHHRFTDHLDPALLEVELPRTALADPGRGSSPPAHPPVRLPDLDASARNAIEAVRLSFERAKAVARPSTDLWPQTHYRLFDPGYDQWGLKGVPPEVNPLPERLAPPLFPR